MVQIILEIAGGLFLSPPSEAGYRSTPVGRGLKFKESARTRRRKHIFLLKVKIAFMFLTSDGRYAKKLAGSGVTSDVVS